MSDRSFTIAPLSSLMVASPNGGETWVKSTTPTITWTSKGTVGSNVKIELLKAGTPHLTLSGSTPNDGSFASWTIPTSVPTGTDYRIRITSTSNPTITDTSDSNFAIIPQSSLTVINPNGGETWVKSTTPTITWTSKGDVGSYVKIELLKAGTPHLTISGSTPNDGTYASWLNPTSVPMGTDYRIRITSTTNPSITDTSDGDFTITPGTITVRIPNGGQNWKRGTDVTITWDYAGNAGPEVMIVRLDKTGATVGTITAKWSIGNNGHGSFLWKINPTGTTGESKIKIQSLSQPSIFDTSDNYFTLLPASSPGGLSAGPFMED